MHRGGVVLLLIVLLLWPSAVQSRAAGESGTVRVVLEPGMADSLVSLYRVGSMNADGLELGEAFGGGYITREDLKTRELAKWLAEQASEGTQKRVSDDGTVMFSGLEEGIYLLAQREASAGYYAISPVLIALPGEEGSWYARVCPSVEKKEYIPPETGQPVAPVLCAMGMILSALLIGNWYETWHKSRRK